MLTRRIWSSAVLLITFVAASVALAADRNDDKTSGAQFVSAPACEVPDHNSSGHFALVQNSRSGLIGGSYGEIFFASGAGARGATTTSATTGTTSTGSSGMGNDPPSGSGAPAANSGSGSTAATTNGNASASANGDSDDSRGVAGTATAPGLVKNDSSGSSGGVSGNATGHAVTSQAAVNPEPATLILLGTGLSGLLLAGRRRGGPGRRR